jgi:hypothetical protein
MCRRVLFPVISCTLLLAFTVTGAEIPRLITFQGQLTDEFGEPVPDDVYALNFLLYTDSLAGDLLWNETQSVEVEDGLFNVQLGLNSHLHDSLFAQYPNLFVAMNLGLGSPEFTPRTRLTAGAFAFHALNADTADYVRAGGPGGGWFDEGAVVRLQDAGDKVGIGTATPSEPLVVGDDLGSFGGTRVVIGDNSPGVQTGLVVGQDNANRAWVLWDVDDKYFSLGTRENATTHGMTLNLTGGKVGIGTPMPSEPLVVGKDLGSYAGDLIVVGNDVAGAYSGIKMGKDANNNGFIIWNNDEGGLRFATKEAGTSYDVWQLRGGRLAVGDPSPFAQFTVKTSGTGIHAEITGSMGGNAILGKANTELGTGVKGMATGEDGKGVMGKADGLHGYGVYGEATLAGVGVYGDGKSQRGVGVKGVSELGQGAGVVGVADGENGHGVSGRAMGVDGRGVYAKADYEDAIAIEAWADGLRGKAFYGKANQGGGVGLEVEALGSSGVGLIARTGSNGTGAKIYGNVLLYSSADQSLIMELGEGLDYAEGFDIAGADEIAPGTVLRIDPDHPGELTVCRTAYDTKVAGIVAGAGGLGSGVRLGADGYDQDVALAGRVYCNVEGGEAGIEPGDLLTTSSTPGYAMKAADHELAQGAILGKAMEKLEPGHSGQILVLVTLQ